MSVSEFYTNLTILRLPDPRTRQIKNAIVYTYVRARRSVVMALVAAAGIRTRHFNFCKIEKKKKSHGFKKRALPAHRLDGKKTPSRAPTPGARDGSMPPSAEKKARNKKMAFPAHRFEGKKPRHREFFDRHRGRLASEFRLQAWPRQYGGGLWPPPCPAVLDSNLGME